MMMRGSLLVLCVLLSSLPACLDVVVATVDLLQCPNVTEGVAVCGEKVQCIAQSDICDGRNECAVRLLPARRQYIVASDESLCPANFAVSAGSSSTNGLLPNLAVSATTGAIVRAPTATICIQRAILQGALAVSFNTSGSVCYHQYPGSAMGLPTTVANQSAVIAQSNDPRSFGAVLLLPGTNIFNTPATVLTRASLALTAPPLLTFLNISNEVCLEAGCERCLYFDMLCDSVPHCADFGSTPSLGSPLRPNSDEDLCRNWIREPTTQIVVSENTTRYVLMSNSTFRDCRRLALLMGGIGSPHSFDGTTSECRFVKEGHIAFAELDLRSKSPVAVERAHDNVTLYFWASRGLAAEAAVDGGCLQGSSCTGHGVDWNSTSGNAWRSQTCPCNCSDEWTGRRCSVPRRMGQYSELLLVFSGHTGGVIQLPRMASITAAVKNAILPELDGANVTLFESRFGVVPYGADETRYTLFLEPTGDSAGKYTTSGIVSEALGASEAVKTALRNLNMSIDEIHGTPAVTAPDFIEGCSFEARTYGTVWDFTDFTCALPKSYTSIGVAIRSGAMTGLTLGFENGTETTTNCTHSAESVFGTAEPGCRVTHCTITVPPDSGVNAVRVVWTPDAPVNHHPVSCPYAAVVSGALVPPTIAPAAEEITIETYATTGFGVLTLGIAIGCGGGAFVVGVVSVYLYVTYLVKRIAVEGDFLAHAGEELAAAWALNPPPEVVDDNGIVVRETEEICANEPVSRTVIPKHPLFEMAAWALSRIRLQKSFMENRGALDRQRLGCSLLSLAMLLLMTAVSFGGLYATLIDIPRTQPRAVLYGFPHAGCEESPLSPVASIAYVLPAPKDAAHCDAASSVGSLLWPLFGTGECKEDGVRLLLSPTAGQCRDSPLIDITLPYTPGNKSQVTCSPVDPQVQRILPPSFGNGTYFRVVCTQDEDVEGEWWQTLSRWTDTTSSIRVFDSVVTRTPRELLPYHNADGTTSQLFRTSDTVRLSSSFDENRVVSASSAVAIPSLQVPTGALTHNIIVGQTDNFDAASLDLLGIANAARAVLYALLPGDQVAPNDDVSQATADPSFSTVAGPDMPAGVALGGFPDSDSTSWEDLRSAGQVYNVEPGGNWDLGRFFGRNTNPELVTGLTVSAWVRLSNVSEGFVWAFIDGWEKNDGTSPLLDTLRERILSGTTRWDSEAAGANIYAALYVSGPVQRLTMAHTPAGEKEIEAVQFELGEIGLTSLFNGGWHHLSIVFEADPLSGGASRARLHVNGFSSQSDVGWSVCVPNRFDPFVDSDSSKTAKIAQLDEILLDAPVLVAGRLFGAVARVEVHGKAARSLAMLFDGSRATQQRFDDWHAYRLPLAIVSTVVVVITLAVIRVVTVVQIKHVDRQTCGFAAKRTQQALEVLQCEAMVRRIERLKQQRVAQQDRRAARWSEWEGYLAMRASAMSPVAKYRFSRLKRMHDAGRLAPAGDAEQISYDDVPSDVAAEAIQNVLEITPAVLCRVMHEAIAVTGGDPEQAILLLYGTVYDKWARDTGHDDEPARGIRQWNVCAAELRETETIFSSTRRTFGGFAPDRPEFIEAGAKEVLGRFTRGVSTELASAVVETSAEASTLPRVHLSSLLLALLIGMEMGAVVAFTWPAPAGYLRLLRTILNVMLFDVTAVSGSEIPPIVSMLIRTGVTATLTSIVAPGIVPEVSNFGAFVAGYCSRFNKDLFAGTTIALSAEQEHKILGNVSAKHAKANFRIKRCEAHLMHPEQRGLLNVFARRIRPDQAALLGDRMLYMGDVLHTVAPSQQTPSDEDTERDEAFDDPEADDDPATSRLHDMDADDNLDPRRHRPAYTDEGSRFPFLMNTDADADGRPNALKQQHLTVLAKLDDEGHTEFRRDFVTGQLRWRQSRQQSQAGSALMNGSISNMPAQASLTARFGRSTVGKDQSGTGEVVLSSKAWRRLDELTLVSRINAGVPLDSVNQGSYYPLESDLVKCCAVDNGHPCGLNVGRLFYDPEAPLFAVCENHVYKTSTTLALTQARHTLLQIRRRGIQVTLLRPCLWLLMLLAVPFAYQAIRILTCDPLLSCEANIPCWTEDTSPRTILLTLLATVDLCVYAVLLPLGMWIALAWRKNFLMKRVFWRRVQPLPEEEKEKRRAARELRREEFKRKYQAIRDGGGVPKGTFDESSGDDEPHVRAMEWADFLAHDKSPLALFYRSHSFKWMTFAPIIMLLSIINVVGSSIAPAGNFVRHIVILAVAFGMVGLTSAIGFAPRGITLVAYRLAFLHPLALATVCLFNDWHQRETGDTSTVVAYAAVCVSGVYVLVGVCTGVYGGLQRSVSTQGDASQVAEMFLRRGIPPVTGTAFMEPDGLDYE